MTFAQPFELRAGLPTAYLVSAVALSLLVQIYLTISWLEGKLDVLWFCFSLLVTVSAITLVFFLNQRQKKYTLHWHGQPSTYKLYLEQKEQGIDTRLNRYTIQTGKLIFVSFILADTGTKHLVFHQALNEKNAFRRFKVRLSWDQPESSKFTAKHPD